MKLALLLLSFLLAIRSSQAETRIWQSTYFPDTAGSVLKLDCIDFDYHGEIYAFAVTNKSQLYLRHERYATWVRVLNKRLVNSVCIGDPGHNEVFIMAGTDKGIYLSFDRGYNWLPYNNGLKDTTAFIMEIDEFQNAYAYLPSEGLFVLDSKIGVWTKLNTGTDSIKITAVENVEKDVYIGTEKHGIYRKMEKDTAFNKYDTGLADKTITDLFFNWGEGRIYATTENDGIFYRDLDPWPRKDTAWIPDNDILADLATTSVDGYEGVIIDRVPSDSPLLSYPYFLILGTRNNGFYHNYYNDWVADNEGLTDLNINDVAFCANCPIFAATKSKGVFIKDFLNVDNVIEVNNSDSVSVSVSHGSLAIHCNLSGGSPLRVSVSNIVGEEILRKDIAPADGSEYEIPFDNVTFAPGAYFVRIETVKGVIVKKFIWY